MEGTGQRVAVGTGTTAGKAKEAWLEVMFYLSCFFGALHFAGVLGQVAGMVAHTVFKTGLGMAITSSMLMGHLYLTFLAAYVGPKEFVRWFRRTDDDVLSPVESRKITRGMYIVIGWALFTGIVVLFQQMDLIAEVPQTLLYTLGEVLTLLCGTEVSKYLRTRQAVQVKQDTENTINYADRAIEYARQKGGIDNAECQREFGLSQDQASRLLSGLAKKGKMKYTGYGRSRRYVAV
jgi:hypothetical protein